MTTEPKASEYADGLRALADLIEANPDLEIGYAIRNMSQPGLKYDELDALARAGASAGAVVTETTDDQWRNVTATFGRVSLRGFGRRQLDPTQPCPTCGAKAGCAEPEPTPPVGAEAVSA